MGVYEEEEPSAFYRHRLVIACGVIAVFAIVMGYGKKRFDRSAHRQNQQMIMIDLPPPLPPPLPPSAQAPPPPKVTEQKLIEQEPMDAMEAKPADTPQEEPPADAGPVLGTGIQGDGPADAFGLRKGNSLGGNTVPAMARPKNSRWGWYASQVQSAISQALQSNPSTRTADFRIVAQVWSDHTGRITRAHLAGSTGNRALDNALTNEVLVGLILRESPPEGMPMPILLRLTARHAPVAVSR